MFTLSAGVNKDGEEIYTFQGDDFQMRNYFWRLNSKVEILNSCLRDEFKKEAEAVLKIYKAK